MQIPLRTLLRAWRELLVHSGPSSSGTTVVTTVHNPAVQAPPLSHHVHVEPGDGVWLMPLKEKQFRNSLEQLWRVIKDTIYYSDVGFNLMHT